MTSATSPSADGPSLDDRYLLEAGPVYLSGLQALVRLPIDQQRRDRRAGLRIGTFVSGYPGSPLGGYDLALRQAGRLLEVYDIRHVPGANEELAATAISGTQMLDHYPHSRYDGVVALWYGKGPGVDRSGDALKHGNFAGTSQHGAVVVLSGDDHEAKSSTMPYQDDYAFVGHGMPILYPASTGAFLELGLHAIAMSRYSGCWTAMKIVNALADGGQTVKVDPDTPRIALPELLIDGEPFHKSTDFTFFPGTNIETERRLFYERHQAVLAYARANRLNRVEVSTRRDRLGLITAGKSYADLCQALLDFGLTDEDLRQAGVRLLRFGLIYPLDAELVRAFADGLEEIVVVEEKRGFLESQVKEALCGLGQPIRVVGKLDQDGAPLFPIQGGMDPDVVAERLGPRLLAALGPRPSILERLAALRQIRSRGYATLPGRTPNYCSGCPHNTSTRLSEGQLAWGSPGCHSFASIIEQPERHIVSMTQLGGEGLPWIGLSPYTDRPHIVQNVGDGSLFHSSYLNIRFCVAAGVSMTFKILYNGSVANTGAQAPVGQKDVPQLARLLALEGVARVAIVAKEPERYAGVELPENAGVFEVDQQLEVQRELEQQPGVTVLIYDGECANERRRRQKRGLRERPNEFVVVNEAVCEDCGHCGALTNCMSLHKVPTEFGEKTQIHASSCNQDYSCLAADCPAFVSVVTTPGTGYRKPTPPALSADELPEPTSRPDLAEPYEIYLPGVGGTGVITLNALLCYAALFDGLRVASYDQTGAAQKWGPVLSSLVVARADQPIASNRVGLGKADLYLALDLLAAASKVNLDRCDPRRTVAVLNMTPLPSGEQIRGNLRLPIEALEHAITTWTAAERTVRVEARALAERLFGDYMATNLVTLGAAYQAGLLPFSAGAIEQAIRLNGVEVEQNLQAFRYGRLRVVRPERATSLLGAPRRTADQEQQARAEGLGRAAGAYTRMMERCAALDEETRRLLAVRVAELIDYQSPRYAERYLDFVLEIARRDGELAPGSMLLARAVARHLYKLMAYKDEYEVARLQLAPEFQTSARAPFSAPRQLIYHLHPPLLRALGLRHKLRLGDWVDPLFGLLRRAKRLRGTPLDPFGYAEIRRQERRLINWYREQVDAALRSASPADYGTLVELAEVPDAIRGYETIKLASIPRAEARASELRARLGSQPSPAAFQLPVI